MIREEAKKYIACGFRPIPIYGVDDRGRCRCNDPSCKDRDAGKHTTKGREDDWKAGYKYTSAEFTEQDNIALAMGPQESAGQWLVALDADGPFDWARIPGLPVTLTAKSPRGEHRIYWVPAYEPLGNWVDVFKTKPKGSLDIRYARGRIVVWPSRNAFGQYRWLNFNHGAVTLPRSCLQKIYAVRKSHGLPVLQRWAREGKSP